VFQVHGIDVDERVVVRKRLRRSQIMRFFQDLAPCLVGLEACPTGPLLGTRTGEARP
jgi:transposase